MQVIGFDLDVREESVVIEEHRASSVVGHVKPFREELVVNRFNRFLQWKRNLILMEVSRLRSDRLSGGPMMCHFPAICCSIAPSFPRRSLWIPAFNAESLLYSSTDRRIAVEEILLSLMCRVFWRISFAGFCEGFSNVDRVSFQNSVEVCIHPRGKTISYEGDVFLIT